MNKSEFELVIEKPPTEWPQERQDAVAALLHRIKTGKVPEGYEEVTESAKIPKDERTETKEEAEQIAAKGEPIELPLSMTTRMEEYPEIFAVRFLMARKWHVGDATKMVLTCARHRLSKGLDTAPVFPTYVPIQGWSQEELKASSGIEQDRPKGDLDRRAAVNKAVYGGGWHKKDKLGCPVWIERTGKAKAKEIYALNQSLNPPGADLTTLANTAARVGHIHNAEVGGGILKCENAKRKAQGLPPIFQVTVIQDMEGLSLATLHSPTLNLLKEVSKYDKEVSGEGMARLYIVNAPAMFTVVWAIVKLWMDERTLKKVVVCKPHETAKKLLLAIDEDSLPEFLGGKCTCGGPSLADQKEADAAAAESEAPESKKALECFCVPDLTSSEAALEAEAALEGSSSFAKTQIIVVKAGKVGTVDFGIQASDETILWEYAVDGGTGYDVKFKAEFREENGVAKSIAIEGEGATRADGKIPKTVTGSGSFTSPSSGAGGKVVFSFDNSFSWMTGKTVQFRVTRASGVTEALEE